MHQKSESENNEDVVPFPLLFPPKWHHTGTISTYVVGVWGHDLRATRGATARTGAHENLLRMT